MKTNLVTTIIIIILVSTLAIVIPVKADSTVFHVDDDYNETTPGWGTTHFGNIKEAVDNAYGSWHPLGPTTILVHEGNYDGFIEHISGSTVKAAPGEKPIINGRGVTNSFGQELGQVVGIVVADCDTTVKGFTIKGKYSVGILVLEEFIWIEDGEIIEQFPLSNNKIIDNIVDQTGFDPGGLEGVTWDGSAIIAYADSTIIKGNVVKFGPSNSPHNGINVFYNRYTIEDNTVIISEGQKYQVGINVRGTATVEKNKVICPDKTIGSWTKVFGIWIYGNDEWSPATLNALVKKNKVYKTDYAVWLTGKERIKGTIIKENVIVNNGFGIIHEWTGSTPGDWAGIIVEDNKIKNFWWYDYYPYPPH